MTGDAPLPRELATLMTKLPRDEAGPVFGEPWQAQAFAMAVALHARGHFTWGQWARRLGAALEESDPLDPTEHPDVAYYRAWLSALEQLIAQKGLVDAAELARRKQAWERAAHATPHGEPIVLGREL